MRPIRNSAKAVIIKDGKLLLTKNEDQFGVFYLLPGGGQEPEENLHEALERECREEISADISIGDIRFVREYIGKNHEFAQWDADIHQIEYMFECELLPGSELKNGTVPDSTQVGIEWIELEKLKYCRIYPAVIKQVINEDGSFKKQVYLGDVN